MTGHRALERIRYEGYKPAMATIVLIDCDTAPVGPYNDPELAMQNGEYPLIVVTTRDNPHTLDLRAVRDMIIQIAGTDRDRCISMLSRVAQFEPEKAIATGWGGIRAWKPTKGFFDL